MLIVTAEWTTVSAQSYLSVQHYKYRVTLQVYQSVAAAYGSHRPIPQLVMIPATNPSGVIARFVPKPIPQVWLDEKLYDVCGTLGKDSLNALACIVGHELSHYYQRHDWAESFVCSGSVPTENSNPGAWRAVEEAVADRDGVFYAYAADYQPYALAARLFDATYRAYHLPEAMEGYPTRTERIALIVKQAKEAQQYAQLQEVGKFLWLKKEFAAAEQCFAVVAENFPSKESWNNQGVCQLAQAAERMSNEEMYFAYPFEIDASSRLLNSSSRGGSAEPERSRVKPLLEKAILSAQRAKLLHSTYVPAYVNWAPAETLQGNHLLAIGLIDKLDGYLTHSMSGNAYLIRGIARVKTGQFKEAAADFRMMQQQGAYQSAYNYALFEKIHRSWLHALQDWVTQWPTVESWIQQYFMTAPVRKGAVKAQPESLPGWIMTGQTASGNTFEEIARLPHPAPLLVMQCSNGGISGFRIQLKTQRIYLAQPNLSKGCRSARGLQCGDSVKSLISKYGSPSRTAAGNMDTIFYVYDPAGLIAEVVNGSVKSWMVYRTETL